MPLISSYSYATSHNLFFFHFFSNIKKSSIHCSTFIHSPISSSSYHDYCNMPSLLIGEIYFFLLTMLPLNFGRSTSDNLSWLHSFLQHQGYLDRLHAHHYHLQLMNILNIIYLQIFNNK